MRITKPSEISRPLKSSGCLVQNASKITRFKNPRVHLKYYPNARKEQCCENRIELCSICKRYYGVRDAQNLSKHSATAGWKKTIIDNHPVE